MRGFRNKFYFFKGFVGFVLLVVLVCCSKPEAPIPPEPTKQSEFKADYGPDIYEPDNSFKVVGYLTLPGSGNGRSYLMEQDFSRMTHLNLSFLNPNSQGELMGLNNFDLEFAVDYLHKNDVKVFISLAGGLIRESTLANWKRLLASDKRSEFIFKISQYVQKNNLDGVDVDLENNIFNEVGNLYEPFVLELRRALHSYGKAISAAMYPISVHSAVTDKAIDAFDFINVMVYNLRGLWNLNNVGPHSPFSMVGDSYDFWAKTKGVSPKKLILGMPFYGWDFAREKSSTYAQIISLNPLNAYTDNVEKIYYNGIPTIVQKVQYAKEHFSGVMFWQYRHDSADELSLLSAISQTIDAGDCEVMLFYRDQDADGLGDPLGPKVSCQQPDGYVANREDDNDNVKV